MKILHILYESEGDYFGIGGVATRAYEIYRYLKDRHDITLLCKKYPGANNGDINGLRHVFVGIESKNLIKTFLSYAYHSSLFVKKYGNEYDIIIEEFSPAIPTFFNTFTKRPIILQVQGYTGLLYFKKYNPLYAFTLYMIERLKPFVYHNFIFVNEKTFNRLLSHRFLYHILKMKNRIGIEIIPNGISPELITLSPEEGDYILYLGRIDVYSKGLDTLIKAYSNFCNSFPEIKLVIAGDGRDREKFNAMIESLPDNIRKNIELMGWVNGDKKKEILRRAIFCVFPSRHEVQPISVLEAMACGKAVIVSDIPEFSYVVNERAGILFKTGDFLSLFFSMKDLMKNNRRKEMGMRGRELVKHFTWDKIADKYENFLKEIFKEL